MQSYKMLSVDHTLLSTEVADIIHTCATIIKAQFRRTKGDENWKGFHQYTNDAGLKCYLRHNRFKEYDKLFLDFSPHKLFNNNQHNANNVCYSDLLAEISSCMQRLGVRRMDYSSFKIVSIEIGTNFCVHRDPYFVLNSALMIGNMFFQKTEYEHYRTAGNSKKSSKYFKAKFYIKSEQTITQTGLNFAELGYCLPNTMRFEIKLERADKFKFMDFSSLEALFGKTAEDTLKEFLAKEFHRIFFFCWQSIDKASLHSVPQWKNYYQFQLDHYWGGVAPGKRAERKKYYLKLPKVYDLKAEMDSCFPFQCQKKNLDFP